MILDILKKALINTVVNLHYDKTSQSITRFESEYTIPCDCKIMDVCNSTNKGIEVLILPLIEVKLFRNVVMQKIILPL